MKTPLLIAIIAAAFQVVVTVFYVLYSFELVRMKTEVYHLMIIMSALSSVGLLIFFILFYDKESKT